MMVLYYAAQQPWFFLHHLVLVLFEQRLDILGRVRCMV